MNRICQIVVNEQRVGGTVVMASENRKSLILELDEPVRVAGGSYFTFMPLLMDDAAGEYMDLVSGRVVKLEWEP